MRNEIMRGHLNNSLWSVEKSKGILPSIDMLTEFNIPSLTIRVPQDVEESQDGANHHANTDPATDGEDVADRKRATGLVTRISAVYAPIDAHECGDGSDDEANGYPEAADQYRAYQSASAGTSAGATTERHEHKTSGSES